MILVDVDDVVDSATYTREFTHFAPTIPPVPYKVVVQLCIVCARGESRISRTWLVLGSYIPII